MFEYDRLALDLRTKTEPCPMRRSSSGSFSSGGHWALSSESSDGGSSGYGSPHGSPLNLDYGCPSLGCTPLASPQSPGDARWVRSSDDELGGMLSLLKLSSPIPSSAAIEDGFSNEEIADFEQLLCSPKRVPPSKYQCHICYSPTHYISDCPMRFNSPYEELTPYQGRKKCYGEFQCAQCKRKWTSQNSVANEAQSCIKCHVPVFPHKQLPVDKAIAMGLIKAPRIPPAKLAPIGHGRPPIATRNN